MRKTKINFLVLAAAFAFAASISSCKKDKEEDPNPTPVEEPTPAASYTNGVFITCEGQFVGGNGTVSFYNRASGAVSNDIFNAVNSAPLGNLVQSMEIYNDKGYIVVNNANKIEVVNATTFKTAGTISGLSSPRYFVGIDANKAYVSQWGPSMSDKGIRVVNLSTNTAGALISTGASPEKMLKVGNIVYVASDGYSNNNAVLAINTTTDAVIALIPVGANPNSLALDKNGKIWVLCGGRNDSLPLPTAGQLVRINPTTNTVEATIPFPNSSVHPINLVINKAKDILFYLGDSYHGELASFAINDTAISSSLLNRGFYGLGIDPVDDIIYASDDRFFAGNGFVLRYTSLGTLLDSFQVGIGPGNFCFK